MKVVSRKRLAVTNTLASRSRFAVAAARPRSGALGALGFLGRPQTPDFPTELLLNLRFPAKFYKVKLASHQAEESLQTPHRLQYRRILDGSLRTLTDATCATARGAAFADIGDG